MSVDKTMTSIEKFVFVVEVFVDVAAAIADKTKH